MKINKLILTVLFSMLLVTCKQIEEIENFAISNLFEHAMDLSLSESDLSEFAVLYTIDASLDPDFKNNLPAITQYSISDVSYRVASFEGDESTTIIGQVYFSDGTNALGSPVDLGVINLKEMADSGDIIKLQISDPLKKSIEQSLLTSHTVVIGFAGTVSDKPMEAVIVVAMEIEALVSL